jgi:hypothetical protein
MRAHQDGERRRIPRPCAPTPAAIPIAPLQLPPCHRQKATQANARERIVGDPSSLASLGTTTLTWLPEIRRASGCP